MCVCVCVKDKSLYGEGGGGKCLDVLNYPLTVIPPINLTQPHTYSIHVGYHKDTYKKLAIAFPFFEDKKIASKKAFSMSQNKSRLMRLMPALETVKELKVRALIFG